jgi:catechol 2,3-dioxygenase-like lactoylglutathione lyase family enzyme
MSIFFGGIRQLGLVVSDAEAAMAAWGRAGVGPFNVMTFEVDDFVYRGKPSPSPKLTLCFAHSGPLQIELIQQHNDVPSVYRDFLAQGREGAQHISSWFGDHDSYNAKRQELIDQGFEIIQEGGSRKADARFAYFQTNAGGLMFEISEALIRGPDSFRGLEQAADSWDGRDVVLSRVNL